MGEFQLGTFYSRSFGRGAFARHFAVDSECQLIDGSVCRVFQKEAKESGDRWDLADGHELCKSEPNRGLCEPMAAYLFVPFFGVFDTNNNKRLKYGLFDRSLVIRCQGFLTS